MSNTKQQKPICDYPDWLQAVTWNKTHHKSEGRMKALYNYQGNCISFYLDTYGNLPAPGFSSCPFPRQNSPAVRWYQ